MEPGLDVRIEGVIKRYHAYWQKLSISEILTCEREYKNCFDVNAIRVVKNVSGDSFTVGHVLCGFSAAFNCFIIQFSSCILENPN